MEETNNMELWETIVMWMTQTGAKIIVAAVVIYFGFKLVNAITRKINQKKEIVGKIDKTLTKTIVYICGIAAKVLIVLAMIGYLGIDTSGMTALIASLGVCFGLAVNGAVANLAGGILILVTRPFKIDDFVEVAGYTGTVEEIHLINTKLKTLDNKVVYIPNGTVSSASVVNYSEKDLRRVDIDFNIAYSCDFRKAKAILAGILEAEELVLKEPDYTIRVVEQAADSIKITCRSWCKNSDYWTVYFNVLEEAKLQFDANDIVIPFKQLDVHIKEK